MSTERNLNSLLPGETNIDSPSTNSNHASGTSNKIEQGLYNTMKQRMFNLQREYSKQQEMYMHSFMDQLEREMNSVNEERKLLQEKERLLKEKARENERVEEDLRTREATLQKNKEILLQQVQEFQNRVSVLRQKEEEQNVKYLKRKEELRSYHDNVTELSKKLSAKSKILEQKEAEIQHWEESHLFRDLRSEMTKLQQLKEQWTREQEAKEAQWRARTSIESTQYEVPRKEEPKNGKINGSFPSNSNHGSLDLGDAPTYAKGRSPMESPVVERQSPTWGTTSNNNLDQTLLKQELPPPISIMDSFSIDERNEKILFDLERETKQLDKLRDSVSATKQDLEISKFRAHDELTKGKQREPFTFKVPQEILTSARQDYNSPQAKGPLTPAAELIEGYDPLSVQSRASIAKSQKLVAQALATPDGFDQYLSSNTKSRAATVPFLEEGLTPIRSSYDVNEVDFLDDKLTFFPSPLINNRGIDDEIMNLNAQLDRANQEDEDDDIHSLFTVTQLMF